MTLCSPWVQPSGCQICKHEDFQPGVFERALEAASWLLYNVTGSIWPGVCEDTVRPCMSAGPFQQIQNPVGDGSRPLTGPGGRNPFGLQGPCDCTGDLLSCGCDLHSSVLLPGTPVVEVIEVLIDGEPFDSWAIVDDRWLIRTDGCRWPCCQALGKPATDEGTWEITYTYGAMPPVAGVLAAEVLACELAKSWEKPGDPDCRLPRRLTQMTREGITVATLDPFQFLDDGRFGLYEVDTFITTALGGRAPGDPGGRVLLASDINRIHRVR